MLSRLVSFLVVTVVLATIGSFVVLAIWDVPVEQTQMEKTLDNSRFLQKS